MNKGSKRETLTYFVILAWLIMGFIGIIKNTDFLELTAYFGSFLIFVGTYIWGESARPSLKSSILKKGKTSKREFITYLMYTIWIFVGLFGIFKGISMASLGAFFAALSPFIGAFILGETYVPEKINFDFSNKHSENFKSDDEIPIEE